jgi:taurine dioxygenase
MRLRPLHEALGAELVGVDFAAPIDAPTAQELRAAFDRHHLLLVRGQDVSADAQVALTTLFGPAVDEFGDGNVAGFISNVMDDAAGSGELPFHSDLSFTTSPVIGISLCAQALPADGTSTWFASSAHAWRTLPAELRDRAEGRRALHTLSAISTGSSASKSREHPVGPNDPQTWQPIPLPHPRTGEPLLYLTDLHTACIDDDVDGSLLAALLAHLYAPANVYEHRWERGDLLVWDNFALQHRRNDVTEATPRTFRRVSLNTHRFFELVPLMPTE